MTQLKLKAIGDNPLEIVDRLEKNGEHCPPLKDLRGKRSMK